MSNIGKQNLQRGVYKHYKGKLYEVLGICLHTETREKLVLYKCLYDIPELLEELGDVPFFVRPYDMFCGTVKKEGKEYDRFEYIGNKKAKDIL